MHPQSAFRLLQIGLSGAQLVRRITFSSGVTRQVNRLARAEQGRGNIAKVRRRDQGNVRIAKIVAGVADILHVGNFDLGVARHHGTHVLHYHHAAGHLNQEVWFGSHDQREGLQRSRNIDLGIDHAAAAAFYLAEIIDVTVRRNRPKHVSRVNTAQLVGARQVVDTELDASSAPSLPAHVGRPFQSRQTRGAMKRNFNHLIQRIGYRNRGPAGVVLRVGTGSQQRRQNKASSRSLDRRKSDHFNALPERF